MRKSKSRVVLVSSLLMGLVLMRFSLSKLLGETEAVNQFIEMAKPLGIDSTLFRIFSGIIISIVAISYLVNAGFIGFKNKSPKPFQLSYILGIFTMVGALVSEFLLRSSPKWPLVVLAILIIGFSTLTFVFLRKKANSDFQ